MTMQMSREEVEEIAEKAASSAVKTTLIAMGIDPSNPLAAQRDFMLMREVGKFATDPEFRKDMEHTRRWRLTMEAVNTKTWVTMVGLVVAGFVSLVVMGARMFFGK